MAPSAPRAEWSARLSAPWSASGVHSTAFGGFSRASGDLSFAHGFFSTASGTDSSAFGASSQASGVSSAAFGVQHGNRRQQLGLWNLSALRAERTARRMAPPVRRAERRAPRMAPSARRAASARRLTARQPRNGQFEFSPWLLQHGERSGRSAFGAFSNASGRPARLPVR